MRDDESAVLANALGELGGIGARWIGKLLPSVDYQVEFELTHDMAHVVGLVSDLLKSLGRSVREFPSRPQVGEFFALIGGGKAGLNPTLVHVSVRPLQSGVAILVRAVAKEGLVKQHSAQGIVRRIEDALREAAT